MKVTLSRATLIKPLQMISGVVERRQTLPILSNVLMMVRDNTLSLTATDLEIELIGTTTLTEPSTEGRITVAARKLVDICRALPEEAMVSLTLDGEQMVLRSGASRFTLTTLPADDFPSIEQGAYPVQFHMSQGQLRRLLGKTHFAMGQQDVRHYLNGALIDINQGVMRCVATDGHRLAYSTTQALTIEADPVRVILPRKSILELMRLLDANNEESMTVCIGDSHFRIITPEFTFTSKLINAQYPDYDRLIPRQVENTAVAGKEALKQALVRAAILSNEKFRGIRLHLDTDQLRIVANNPEQEEAEEMIALEYGGASLEIGFNAAYLLDVVSAIGSEQIRCSFSDPNKGVLIEPTDKSDSLYVVMPMRL